MTSITKEHLEDCIDSTDDEYMRMQYFLALYRPDDEVKHYIKAAYNSKEWDWQQCDGCTLVSEMHSPKGVKFPPCVMHDYLRWLVKQGRMTIGKCDKLFYKATWQLGGWKPRAFVRYWVARWPAWWLWLKWTKPSQ